MKEYTGFEVNGFDEDSSAFMVPFGDKYSTREIDSFAERLGDAVYGNMTNAISNMFKLHSTMRHPVYVPERRFGNAY